MKTVPSARPVLVSSQPRLMGDLVVMIPVASRRAHWYQHDYCSRSRQRDWEKLPEKP
jgi:hypothetical protein